MARYLDVTGQRYGRMVACEYVGKDKNSLAQWLCVCDCGNVKIVRSNSLRRGLTRSCGCLNDEVRHSGVNRIGKLHTDETKKRLSEMNLGKGNGWVLIELAKERKGKPLSEETKRKLSIANKGKKLSDDHVRKLSESHKGIRFKRKNKRVLSDETRRKMSESHKKRGHLNHLYVDGKSAERHSERKISYTSVEYKIWRDSVFKRDNYTCQMCGEKPRRVEADHIQAWSTNPELRYDLSNGRTLCVSCHKKTPTYARKMKK